jgi:hypothetical protein
MDQTIGNIIAAAGAFGTAAFALVDASKILGGGVSRCGFKRIMKVVNRLIPFGDDSPAWHASIEPTLWANWINGTQLADQKAVAKTLIKLRLNEATADVMAARTGVNGAALTAIAINMVNGTPLTADQNAVFGRFDLILTAMLDEAYQRADQIYRNSAKASSVAVSVALALLGVVVTAPDYRPGWQLCAEAFVLGLLASPLAPITKDLSSALAAGVKLAQVVRK